ncbi:MAG: ABC transporter permease [Lachnospiraceae bacterium]|nr:ABC transporter permease [Lachnospiraceae bacterium]
MKKRTAAGAVLSIAALLLLWQIAALGLDRYFLPAPLETVHTLKNLLREAKTWSHVAASFRRITLGMLLGLLCALPLGILMGRAPAADAVLGSFFRLVYPIPKVVFMPIVVVMLGIGDGSKIFLIFLAVLFQITIIIRDSTASLDPVLSDVMRSMKAGPVFTLVHLILPGILPGILTALKATLGTSVALLMITELFASTSGLGYFIMNSMDARKYPEMYSGILLLMAMSALIYVFLEILEKALCRWRYGARDADPQ